MFNKKSQAAMEFLMTYGWAIMIVLIGIGALFFLGVFNPSTPSTCNIASPFICQDVVIKDIGVNFIIFRMASTNIDTATISNIKLNGVACPNNQIKVGYKSDLTDAVTSQDITQSKNKPTYIMCIYPSLTATYGTKVSGSFEISWTKQFGVGHLTQGTYSGTAEA